MSELDLQLEFYINGVAILVIASLGFLGNILSLLLFTFRYFAFLDSVISYNVHHPKLSQQRAITKKATKTRLLHDYCNYCNNYSPVNSNASDGLDEDSKVHLVHI